MPRAAPSDGSTAVARKRRSSGGELLRLVYVSISAPALDAEDLAAIAARSAARNRELGLTGLLMHNGQQFYGILEGPRRRVLACMERIITDRRHRGLRILREHPVETRRFDNWSFCPLPRPEAGWRGPAPEDFIQNLTRRLR